MRELTATALLAAVIESVSKHMLMYHQLQIPHTIDLEPVRTITGTKGAEAVE